MFAFIWRENKLKADKMQRVYRPPNCNRKEPVKDLREKLNRIRQEKALHGDGIKNPPPPDPAYSFLRDPLRGDDYANTANEKKVGNKDKNAKAEIKSDHKNKDDEQKNPTKPIEKSLQKNRNANFDRPGKPPGGWRKQNWNGNTAQNREQPRKFNEKGAPQDYSKQQPVNNIKIELSSESGERKCIIDETTKVQVPMSSKRNYTFKPKSGKWLQRGPQKYYTGKNKQRSPSKNDGKREEAVVADQDKAQLVPNGENVQKAENISNNNKTKLEAVEQEKVNTETANEGKVNAKTVENKRNATETVENKKNALETAAEDEQIEEADKQTTTANKGD